MSKLSKVLIVVAIVAGVLLAAIGFFWPRGERAEAETQVAATEPAPPAPAGADRPSFFTKRPRRQTADPVANSHPIGAPAAATNLISAWEDKLDEILGSASPDEDKARQLVEMFPHLPTDGQEETAQHLSNLLPDADFGLLHAYLTNTALAEDVLDVLLDDVLNRPNRLKLPALLDVARSPQHPNAAEAKDFLELFLEEDYGDDWDKWQTRMQEWLKDNPD